MSKKEVKDMTSGSPVKLIIGFLIPLLGGILFQQFYSMMDSIIVGKILGTKAFAAVGGTGSVNFLVIGFCMGICNGFAIPVAQAVGAKKDSLLRKCVANSAWLTIFFSVVITALVCIFCKNILVLMRTPDDLIDNAYKYIFIIFAGIPIIFLYNILAGILRSLGESKVPLYFLILSSLLNIALDLLFIAVLKMGVEGAAYATNLAQLISGVLCLIYMKKRYTILHITKEEWKPDKDCIKRLLSMGIPMGLQYSITAIGTLVLQTAVNTMGSMTVAAVAAGNRVNMLLSCPYDAMGSTMTTYVGQNRGANDFKRIKKGIWDCSKIALVYSIFVTITLFFAGKYLSLMYLEAKDIKAVADATTFLRYLGYFSFPLALVNIIRFSIQGMGYSGLAVIAGFLEMVARSVVGFIFVPMFGFVAVCLAHPSAWIAADLFLIPALYFILRKQET